MNTSASRLIPPGPMITFEVVGNAMGTFVELAFVGGVLKVMSLGSSWANKLCWVVVIWFNWKKGDNW